MAGTAPSEDFAQLHTARLDLRAMDPDDLDGLFPIFSDPETWRHHPTGRHREPATTLAFIERAAARWPTDRLSYWTVRLREAQTVIGVGGAQRRASGTWNLFYRLGPAWHGHGYATELARAAHRAATAVDPSVPFIAWIVEHNTASRRVAERLGLVNYGLRVDGDNEPMLAYADRPLDAG